MFWVGSDLRQDRFDQHAYRLAVLRKENDRNVSDHGPARKGHLKDDTVDRLGAFGGNDGNVAGHLGAVVSVGVCVTHGVFRGGTSGGFTAVSKRSGQPAF